MGLTFHGDTVAFGLLDRSDLRLACFLTGAVPGFPPGTKFRVRERTGAFVKVYVRRPDGVTTENYLTSTGTLKEVARNTSLLKRAAEERALAA